MLEPNDPRNAICRELAKLGVNVDAFMSMNPTRKALEELLEGTLKLFGRKIHPERQKKIIETVESQDHLFAVYPDNFSKFDEAFEFLKDGLVRNESVMLITDDLTKEDVLKRMSREWNIDAESLEKKGDIILKSTKEWYFPTNTFDPQAMIEKWRLISKASESKGKVGLRVFGDTSAFFRHGLEKQLVEYETTLQSKFGIPLTAICCYIEDDVKTLDRNQVHMLQCCHKVYVL